MEAPKEPVLPAASPGIDLNRDGQQPEASGEGHDAAGDDHDAAGGDRANRFSEGVQTLRLEKQPVDLRRPRRRWWLLALLLLAIVAGGVYVYRNDALRNVSLSGPIEVESFQVTGEQPAEVVLDTTGNVVAPITVDITPQVAGKVVELNLDEQKKVSKGELLLRIEGGQYEAELEQAKAALAAANARLAEAEEGSRDEDKLQAKAALDQAKAQRDLLAKELDRTKRLEGAISQAERDQVEANFREAEANVDRLSHALKLVELGPREEQKLALKADVDKAKAIVSEAQFYYDCTSIHSPIDGTVLQRSVELGEVILVQPGIFATSIASIADLSQLEVEIEIQERDLATIRIGQPCSVTPDAYPDRQYRGRVDRLAPMLSRERGTRQAKVVLTSPDSWLATNMNCRVQILKEDAPQNRQNVIRVPQEAIVKEDGQAFVLVAEEGKVQRRSVRLGAAAGGKVEVPEGLSGGEEVLLPGDKKLEEGQPVRTRPGSSGSRG